MNGITETKVNIGENIEWDQFTEHKKVYNREIVKAKEADELGIGLSSILWEKLEVGGQVLPHYHDVVEIIHITVGQVQLLCNNEWKKFKAGDTFLIPKRAIHSVKNDGTQPSEQISIFLPAFTDIPPNQFFGTTLTPENE
ncbi:cupin domain-containing protein [Fictibacillus enclensis]|uniref:cupin domain-containing protein n=1 Tax=Fictibacillus enclensis TaxID=1017270 RepID=UPI0025A0F0F1|nr:cupin domain-containing protein [Fictibacillus enclensis]MDM5340527.1 cupin domain-containing protein [Fictibacillus enclensis]